MELQRILKNFNVEKQRIRNRTQHEISPNGNYDGLQMAIDYSGVMEQVVKGLFNLSAKEMGGDKGIAAFLYGSPGRREMVCESDLDIMLVYNDCSKPYLDFKNRFRELAKPFEFCKIDLPEWGSVDEAATFAKKSITEGNQVLDCKYVCGDTNIDDAVKGVQQEFGDADRMVRNIVFQRFYFDQYFKQRVRNGAINVKYCDGGSRDYMFLDWFDQLMKRKYSGWNKAKEGRPVAEQGLSNLYQNGLITPLEFGEGIDSLHFNLLLRNEMLIANKGTSDEGLTFLDEKTLASVFSRMPGLMDHYGIVSPEELSQQFDRQRFRIANIKKRIWNLMLEEKGKELGMEEWRDNFSKAHSKETTEEERTSFINSKDSLIRVATIWGASNSGQTKLLEKLCEKEKDSDSWEIQASLATSLFCPPEHLHHVAEGIGRELGYGYVLRIISRNPRVKQETLELIAKDPKIEPRYSQCARAALENGRDVANHQV
jgi:hypothetical protein